MKLIYPKELDKTPIIVNVSDGTFSKSGVKNIALVVDTKCRKENSSRWAYDSKGAKKKVSNICYIGWDIAPLVEDIFGTAVLNNKSYDIYKGRKFRNPDGTVCYVKLELI